MVGTEQGDEVVFFRFRKQNAAVGRGFAEVFAIGERAVASRFQCVEIGAEAYRIFLYCNKSKLRLRAENFAFFSLIFFAYIFYF